MNLDLLFNPLLLAWDRMTARLFERGSVGKWLRLGVVAWFTDISCGIGGIVLFLLWREKLAEVKRLAEDWMVASGDPRLLLDQLLAVGNESWHLVRVSAVALSVLWLIAQWVNARGTFMFLHDVARDETAIGPQWRAQGARGNALFVFLLGLKAVTLVVIGALVLVGMAVLVANGADRPLAESIALGLALIGLPLLLWLIAVTVVHCFLIDFVVPLTLRFDLGLVAAWGYFARLLWHNKLVFFCYPLAKAGVVVAASIAIGIAAWIVGLLTLGIVNLTALPYLTAVLLLPVLVYYRCFSLEFLRQFDPAYNLFVPEPGEDAVPQEPQPVE